MSRSESPIRILHVLGGMVRGGVETWLMHVLRHIDREHFQMDFLVHTTQPCAYDDEIRALGSQIIPCLDPPRPWLYAHNFKRILREHGPYDIVHSHVHHYSGYVLRLAQQAGVPVRMAHCHNDTSQVEAQAGLLRRGYLTLMKRWIAQHATVGLAASRLAAADLFGPVWEADPRWQILHYGIDLTPFRNPVDPVAVRAELNIPAEAFVMGHIGRFAEQKNHAFLVDIAIEVAKHEPRTRLLLVGDGLLRPAIEQKVAQADLTDRVIFAGLRADVPRLMRGVMDVFVLPSFYEGLPLVGIEAQAAGLPVILSDAITEEIDRVRPLVQRLSLSHPASVWAEVILAVRDTAPATTQQEALAVIEKSSFDIQTSVKSLAEVYLVCSTTNVAIEPTKLSSRPYEYS
jgi:glycosyltransferase involved in cell wall biosynthesis